MSHISKISLEIKNLQVLKKACAKLGAVFHEGQTEQIYYMGKQKCDHAISHVDAKYEIGIVKSGKNWELQWDSYFAGGLESIFGKDAGLLKQRYAVEQTKFTAMLKGMAVSEKLKENGEIVLVVNL